MSKYSQWKMNDIAGQEQNEGIFVRNTGPVNERGVRERILIVVPKDGMEGQDLVSIPNTEIPWDLTEQVSRSSLLRSSDLRKALQKGLLSGTNPEEAVKEISKPAIQREIKFLLEQEDVNLMADANEMIDGGNSILADQNKPAQNPLTGSTSAALDNSVTGGVSPTVFSVMEMAGDQVEMAVITSIKGIAGKTLLDYQFILKKAKEHGFEELADRVSKRINKMMEEEDEVDV